MGEITTSIVYKNSKKFGTCLKFKWGEFSQFNPSFLSLNSYTHLHRVLICESYLWHFKAPVLRYLGQIFFHWLQYKPDPKLTEDHVYELKYSNFISPLRKWKIVFQHSNCTFLRDCFIINHKTMFIIRELLMCFIEQQKYTFLTFILKIINWSSWCT